MKVQHVIYSYFPSYTGGRETIINQLISHGKEYPSINISIVSLRRPKEPKQLTRNGVQVHRVLAIPTFYKARYVAPFNVLLLALKAFRLASNSRVQIVHAHNVALEGFIGVFIKKVLKVKLIIHVHGYVEEELSIRLPFLKPLWKFMSRTCLTNADATIFHSFHILRHELNKNISIRKPIVVRLGVDSNKFHPDGPKYTKKELLGQAGIRKPLRNPMILAQIASLRPFVKGQDRTVEALSDIIKVFPNTYLLFVGKGDQSDLKNLATQLRVSDHVGFLGERKDIPQILRSVDVVVHPSRFEGYGLVLLEAMSCAKPVVATPVGGMKDLVENGVSGLLVAPSKLSETLIKLLTDEELRRKLSVAALLNARRYEWHYVIRKMVEIYGNT